MGAEVFISYSSLDRDQVMPVVESLRGSGISVWVDEGNIPRSRPVVGADRTGDRGLSGDGGDAF